MREEIRDVDGETSLPKVLAGIARRMNADMPITSQPRLARISPCPRPISLEWSLQVARRQLVLRSSLRPRRAGARAIARVREHASKRSLIGVHRRHEAGP